MAVEMVEGSMVIAGVQMSYGAVEGAIIDAMLDTVSYGIESPTFLKLARLLMAVRGQHERLLQGLPLSSVTIVDSRSGQLQAAGPSLTPTIYPYQHPGTAQIHGYEG